jgi:hypothetical protein
VNNLVFFLFKLSGIGVGVCSGADFRCDTGDGLQRKCVPCGLDDNKG